MHWKHFVIFILLNFVATEASTWGLSTELTTSWSKARMVFPAIKNHEIKFCVQIDQPDRFNEESISLQVISAIRLWTQPLASIGLTDIKVKKVSCRDSEFNLKILIGKESEWTNLGSYQISKIEGTHLYSLIKIDSDYVYTNGLQKYPIVDSLVLFQDLNEERRVLQNNSPESNMTLMQLSNQKKVDYLSLFWSTYPSLIHEIGHSFGLCDTYSAEVKDECDSAFSSKLNPSSVMKDSNYFYLTRDDIVGIQQLFLRYLK